MATEPKEKTFQSSLMTSLNHKSIYKIKSLRGGNLGGKEFMTNQNGNH